MYKQASRSFLRSAQNNLRSAQPSTRRFINTAPPHKTSRSWKSSAARWGIAIAGIYYYNTHPMFADATKRTLSFESGADADLEASLPTVDSYSASRRQQKEQQALSVQAPPASSEATVTDDPGALEEEAESQGAFNPETGEINWDCPCLGGMAHGPCGQEFRHAFSCFVYSEQEPKGLDCIDKFKSMQDCFREHPDVYAAELEEDEELDAEIAEEREAYQQKAAAAQSQSQSSEPQRRLLEEEPHPFPISPILSPEAPPARRERTTKPSKPAPQGAQPQTEEAAAPPPPQSRPSSGPAQSDQNPSLKERVQSAKQETASSSQKFDEELDLMPKAWHDGRDAEIKGDEQKKSQ